MPLFHFSLSLCGARRLGRRIFDSAADPTLNEVAAKPPPPNTIRVEALISPHHDKGKAFRGSIKCYTETEALGKGGGGVCRDQFS